MSLPLALLAWLVLAGQQGSATASPAPLAEVAVLRKLRTLTSEVAKTGEPGLVERMRGVLLSLGDDGEELERLARSWERALASARPTRSTRSALAAELRRELAPLVAQLEREDGPRRSALARAILELDADEPGANAVLGLACGEDGRWRSAEERRWHLGARQVADHLLAAAAFEVDVEHDPSALPLLAELGGGSRVRARGVELHGRLPAEKLERILRQALRAAALSHALLSGTLDLPRSFRRNVFVLLDSEAVYAKALEEARTAGGVSEKDHERILELRMGSYLDGRGWRTSAWRSEAEFEALVLWDLLDEWVRPDTQACLRVGHLNWVSLRFLGSSMPLVVWSEEQSAVEGDDRTAARPGEVVVREALWRCARQSLWGTRAWMIARAREGRDPPWARAMLDQDGKIRDASLLKTTLVCEMLQQEGRLGELIEATRAKQPPVPAFEEALGEPLPAFEERWRRWLDPEVPAGLLQDLARELPAKEPASPFGEALRLLNQSRADALADQGPEIPVVALDPDLCAAAELHARYLTRNPGQKSRWPEAHEEFPGAPGFTPEGALSGSRSVISLVGDARRAVHEWQGTFFHRLPLLHPGLLGVGFGVSEEVVVLDAGSLVLAPWKDHVVVWPLPERHDVPRAFVPELPNPVPGADMSTLGHPVTVQLFFMEQRDEAELALELFAGAIEEGRLVDCHFISPAAPLQPELVPPNAWGLIPKALLAKKARYTARARWAGEERVWSFTTGE